MNDKTGKAAEKRQTAIERILPLVEIIFEFYDNFSIEYSREYGILVMKRG